MGEHFSHDNNDSGGNQKAETGSDINDDMLRQAITWFTRLRADDVTDAEQEAYAEWLLSNPEHVDAYAQVEAQWESLETSRASVLQSYASETDELINKARHQSRHPTIWRFGWQTLLGTRPVLRGMLAGAAAIMLLVIGGLVATSLSSGPTSRQVLQTAAGELAQVELSDGSLLDMDADTQLTFLRNRKARTIELHHGAAVFDVAKNRQQPFTVAAGEITYTAVGTRFEVSYRDNQSMITMVEGIVLVRHAEHDQQSYRLSEGDRLIFNANSSVPLRSQVASDQTGLWHSGQSIFEQQALHQVVQHLNRYLSAGQLNIADPDTGNILFSGVIQHDNKPEVIAQRLAGLLPVQYTITGEQITLFADQQH